MFGCENELIVVTSKLRNSGWHLSNERHLDDGSSERAWKVRLTSVKHGLKGRPARRPARRIAAVNYSHLSALSGGLVLLCGGDWEPLLGSPPLLAARPGGTAVARYVTYSAGHTACHHSHLMVPPQLK